MSAEPRIETLRLLGEGAQSRVELVRLLEPCAGLPAGTELARKTLRPDRRDEPRARAALEAEAKTASLVTDPSLVRVRHSGENEDGPYLLLDHVPGENLREALRHGPLPEPRVRSIASQVAGALAALHRQGIAHGDVKPENVRLDPEGRAVLLDLGFAARAGAAAGAGSSAGSLAYLSPERVQGSAPSEAADVFALGLVLYELATGLHPFGYRAPGSGLPPVRIGLGTSSGELLRRSLEVPGADDLLSAIVTSHVLPPSRVFPELSPFLDALLLELLAKRAKRRPPAAEVARRFVAGEADRWWRSRIARAGPVRRSETHLLPLAGRRQELAQLFAAFEPVRRPAEGGRSAIVWLSGPQGSGKWRLANEFATRARESSDPPLYLYGRWKDEVGSRPGGALLLLLLRWLQLPFGTRPGAREEEQLRTLLAPAQARALCSALDPDQPGETGESAAAALAAWLCALGKRAPLIVFLDDVHRAGWETLGALSVLVDALAETRLLLVLGVREDVEPAEPDEFLRLRARVERAKEGGADFLRLELGPLGEGEIRDLVEQVFHHGTPRLRLAHVLWRRSRGNPGLLVEILRSLIERGVAHPVGPGSQELVLTIAPDEIPLPHSLDRLVAERFRALDVHDRMWLERLAVAGGRIAPDFLLRVFPPTGRAEIEDVLARLVLKGWLVPRGDRYRFERPALREAVYRSISATRRRRLHRLAARGLAPEPGRTATVEDAFQRAFHLRSARDHGGLLEVALPLIEDLRRNAATQRVSTLTRWCLEALEELPPSPERQRRELELFEIAVDAADRLGQREEQREFLERLADLGESSPQDPGQGARLYLLHGRYAAATGRFGLARGMLRNAIELAAAAADERLSSQCLRRLAHVQAQIGDFADARKLASRALEKAQGHDQRALAHLALGLLDVLLDRPEDGLERVDLALAEMQEGEQGRLGIVAHALLLRARIWRSAGRPLRAFAAGRRAVRLAQRAGERRLEAEARARLGGFLLDLDRPQEAEALLRDARLLAQEIEDLRGETLAEMFLGLLLWENDDHEAQASIARATELARSIGFYRAESVGCALHARIDRERGAPEEADRKSARAVELLGRHGAELGDRIVILGTRALVLSTLARPAEAGRVAAGLKRRITVAVRRLRDAELKEDLRQYAQRLLEATLSSEGPVFPRTSLQSAE